MHRLCFYEARINRKKSLRNTTKIGKGTSCSEENYFFHQDRVKQWNRYVGGLKNPRLCRQSKLSRTQPWATWSKLPLLWAHRWDHSIHSIPFHLKSCYNSKGQLWKFITEIFSCIPLNQRCEPLCTERSDVGVQPQKMPHVFDFQAGPSPAIQTNINVCKNSDALNIIFCRCLSHSCNLWAKKKRSNLQQGATF